MSSRRIALLGIHTLFLHWVFMYYSIQDAGINDAANNRLTCIKELKTTFMDQEIIKVFNFRRKKR